eukprot:4740768-Pyramimonas_sp.AAC.1
MHSCKSRGHPIDENEGAGKRRVENYAWHCVHRWTIASSPPSVAPLPSSHPVDPASCSLLPA